MKVSNRLLYLAGPYAAATTEGIKLNIALARQYAARFWGMGIPALCPHMNTALFDSVAEPQVFIEGDLEMLRRFRIDDGIFMLPGWEKSRGSLGELKQAKEMGLWVFYYSHPNVLAGVRNWAFQEVPGAPEKPVESGAPGGEGDKNN